MEYQLLGKTGELISRIGFGCAALGGFDYGAIDEDAAVRAVQTAVDFGISFFDVADVYGFGRAEELLAKALGRRCQDVVLATKVGLRWDELGHVHRDGSQDWIKRAAEGSLRRLGVDSIFLYQLHWLDPQTPFEETLAAMQECQRKGLVRHLGVCNVSLEQLKQASRMARIESIQLAYNLLCRDSEEELLTWAATNQVSVIGHSGLARGLLAGKRSWGQRFDGTDTRNSSRYFSPDDLEAKQVLLNTLRDVAWQNRQTSAAVAVRWILDNHQISSALIGMKTPEQVAEAVLATGWRLSVADRERLSVASLECVGSRTGELSRR